MKPIKELKESIVAKSQKIKDIFAEAGPDFDMDKVKSLQGDTQAKLDGIKTLNNELDALHAEYEQVIVLQKSRERADLLAGLNEPKGSVAVLENPEAKGPVKTIGQLFLESPSAKGQGIRTRFDIDPKEALLDIGLKNDFFVSTPGWAPDNLRQPGYVAAPSRPPAVIDNLPIYPTSQNSVVFMLETTFTNNAAEKTEGNAAVESALALTETSVAVQEIATFIPTSRTQLEDAALASAYLTARLGFMVRQRLSYQILNGAGGAPNLVGTLSIGGSFNTQAKATDATPDAIYKLFTLIRTVGYTEPSVLFAHPNDWQDVRLLRTADGLYIFGNPSDAGPDRIWGVRVVQTADCVENTMIGGDYANFAYVAMRRGVEVEMSSGYSDYFVKGKLAVLASCRAAVVHTRTGAFGRVTGV